MAYEVRLRDYEGPLDLLLQLISRAKIDIRDIFISEITEQYLASLEDISSLDMDAASEFLAMAATLLEIKSRALLPKPPKLEEGEESPEEALIRRLAEYAALRQGVESLQGFEQAAARMFEKLPEEIPLPPPVFELPNLTMEGLLEALRRVMARAAEAPAKDAPPRELPRDRLSVQACMFSIASKLRKGACKFEALFEGEPDKNEIVTVFVALLELLRLGRLRIRQTEVFGDILLSERKAKHGAK